MQRRHLLAAAAASFVAAPSIVSAQGSGWPSRGPIRLVAQFPPGGLVDVTAECSNGKAERITVRNVPFTLALGTDTMESAVAPGSIYNFSLQLVEAF